MSAEQNTSKTTRADNRTILKNEDGSMLNVGEAIQKSLGIDDPEFQQVGEILAGGLSSSALMKMNGTELRAFVGIIVTHIEIVKEILRESVDRDRDINDSLEKLHKLSCAMQAWTSEMESKSFSTAKALLDRNTLLENRVADLEKTVAELSASLRPPKPSTQNRVEP